jgi:hypothetical protein
MFSTALDAPRTVEELLTIMTDAAEYDEVWGSGHATPYQAM